MELVKALRSGEYEQGRKVLGDNQDRFCCLGVACAISSASLEWKKEIEGAWSKDFVWAIDGEKYYLPEKVRKEFGFHDSIGGRDDSQHILIKDKKYACLPEVNDDGIPFSDIADYIEKNWERL